MSEIGTTYILDDETTVVDDDGIGLPLDDPQSIAEAEKFRQEFLTFQEDRKRKGLENLRFLRYKQLPIQYDYKEKYSQYRKLKENEARVKGVNPKNLANYPVFKYTPKHNYIGERINFLLKVNNQEIADFCRNVEISRSSLHRYIKGTHVPSEKLLEKIIDALFVDVASFSFRPDDFEEWKSSFRHYIGEDIFEFKSKILEQFQANHFTYKVHQVKRHLPNAYFKIMKSLIENAFSILNLIPHDEDK